MKQKLKTSIFDSPFIVNQTSSQIEFINGKSNFVQFIHFQKNKCLTFAKLENRSH